MKQDILTKIETTYIPDGTGGYKEETREIGAYDVKLGISRDKKKATAYGVQCEQMLEVIADEPMACYDGNYWIIIGQQGTPGKDGTMTFADLTDEEKEQLRGPAGKDGEDGAPGKDGENGKDGAPGATGATGAPGTPGADGFTPTITVAENTESSYKLSITNKEGTFTTPNLKGTGAEPSGQPEVDLADYYTKQEVDSKLQKIELTPGPQGEKGEDGSDGKSAYQLAVANGFGGAEAEWLASLKGADGAPGAKGEDGKDGDKGEDGAPGANGADGVSPTVATLAVEGGTTVSITDKDGIKTFTILNGKDGAPGAKGEDGKQGEQGIQGIQGPQGIPGATYTITQADYEAIATTVLSKMTNAEQVRY